VPSIALALDRPTTTGYRRPTIDLGVRQTDANEFCWPCVLFIVLCVTFAIALAYAAYCNYLGGSADISWQWWPPGFKVQCLLYYW
jgi:hypothetical protein